MSYNMKLEHFLDLTY